MLLTLLVKNNALGHFFAINPCHPPRTPYNAQPLRRHNGLQASGSGGSGSIWTAGKTSQKEVDSEGGKRNIRHLATDA